MLDQAIAVDDASKGTLQLFDEKTNALYIIAHRGFSDQFLEHFKVVKPFDGSSCGRAIGMGTPVIISDFSQDLAFQSHLDVVANEGIAAAASIPIFSDAKEKLGVVSIHFSEPKWAWNLIKLDKVVKDLALILSEIRHISGYEN